MLALLRSAADVFKLEISTRGGASLPGLGTFELRQTSDVMILPKIQSHDLTSPASNARVTRVPSSKLTRMIR